MGKKGNIIKNWDASYRDTNVTYNEEGYQTVGYKAVYEDLKKYLPTDSESKKIVEIGCGGARTSLYLAKHGFKVTCTDNSPEALRLARSNFSAAGASGEFVTDDLFKTQLPSNHFDAIISFGLLEHFEDVEQILKVASNIIRPGGIHAHLIIPKKFSTQTMADTLWFPLRLGKKLVKEPTPWGTLISRSFRDFPHFENAYNHKEYADFFRNTGNEVLRCEAWNSLFPLVSLPRPLGGLLERAAGGPIMKLMKKADRKQSDLMHQLASSIYIVARKK